MASEQSIDTMALNVLLRQTREAQHLTLDTVSSQLNMSLQQLSRLESDDLEPTTMTPFERGYVRNYAAMLNIPTEQIEHYFPSNQVVSDLHSVQRYYSFDDKKPFFARPAGRSFIYLLGIAVVALLLWLLWPKNTTSQPSPQPEAQLLSPIQSPGSSTDSSAQ
ncbi:hypothetical protein THMIRHAS_18600 [Thiosulfatimonas sediminis]|uniref:HTH cro/C1-type domain-containing protein n=2 Tax=Thiosulfatimonas sediminis TaxID=2675054 RepID=A0A6F8PWS4_9GAMM|nr:hypothetical protein THMIRHAS_18600 [Thiosulfatimonas sediminis]